MASSSPVAQLGRFLDESRAGLWIAALSVLGGVIVIAGLAGAPSTAAPCTDGQVPGWAGVLTIAGFTVSALAVGLALWRTIRAGRFLGLLIFVVPITVVAMLDGVILYQIGVLPFPC